MKLVHYQIIVFICITSLLFLGLYFAAHPLCKTHIHNCHQHHPVEIGDNFTNSIDKNNADDLIIPIMMSNPANFPSSSFGY